MSALFYHKHPIQVPLTHSFNKYSIDMLEFRYLVVNKQAHSALWSLQPIEEGEQLTGIQTDKKNKD